MVAIFVAFMFVSLVLTDLAMQKWQAWRVAHRAPAASGANAFAPLGLGALCQVPEGVHLANQHTWVKSNPAGGLEIGADALLVRAVGGVRRIILPQVGEEVTAGQPLFRLEHGGANLTIPAGISGRVMAVNSRLAQEPELLSSDPYGSGWVCYVAPTRGVEAGTSIRFGEQAAMWLENEFARLREFLSAQVAPDLALGVTSQDGGIPAMGCLMELDPAAWSAFEASFVRQA